MIYAIRLESAPLALRERLALTRSEIRGWLTELQDQKAVVLWTCNRLELYTEADSPEVAEMLWGDLLALKGVSLETASPYTIPMDAYEAAEHLFHVGAGLRSIALGEAQILGQAADALELAGESRTLTHNLSLLFRTVIRAGKRVQSETALNYGGVSLASLGIRRLESAFGSLHEARILVIGAGEMGQAALKGFAHRELGQITLVSRTDEKAQEVAAAWGVSVGSMTALPHLLQNSDIIICAAGAAYPLLTADLLHNVAHPLYIMDLSVPRDVAPEVHALPDVQLFDLDDLQQIAAENLRERQGAIPQAEAILSDELARFWSEYQARAFAPTIQRLRAKAEQLRAAELERILHRLPENTDAQTRALLEEFSHRFMNKLLHDPLTALRARATQTDADLFNDMAQNLFGLDMPN